MKPTIVILHGWGISGLKYAQLRAILETKGYKVYTPDFPGFGKERLTKPVMHIDDYVDFVKKYFHVHKIKKAVLVGHSFGGRIAAKFTAEYPKMVEKLILTGAPLIKKPLPMRKKIIASVAKTGKKLLHISSEQNKLRKIIYFMLGEWDYYKSGGLKETLKAVLAEDIFPNLAFIRTPTLVVWGENDTFTPLKLGKEIAAKIPTAKLLILKNVGHKLPYEKAEEFAKVIITFLSS